ncbi:MAG: bifunctional (p)ppGpp synthetase/guanosine-3',5'-bis(diphosphate) 3'-pyrophosphohydrolase [Lachnospiraceae bacterium]|nr:bifunctional (p)ppGpp synthetase/guanosine-3',5'-bis(diphosphate) 3'-pyrophosphohydrolase [Lachnospiraceae bacterium]
MAETENTSISTQVQNEFVIDDGRIESIEEYLSPEELFDDLISRVKKYNPEGVELIRKAFELANNAHKDQLRKSGEPYIIHPIYVAIILADLEMDTNTVIAGILHDIIEDTDLTYEDLKNTFNEDVADIVEGVTKLSRMEIGNRDKMDVQAENLRKMFLAMAKDIRVIVVKLADRLHNMRTLKHMSPEKQIEKAKETLEIYSPIAQRLGISRIKVELDDLSLKYLEPEAYYDLVDKIATRRAEREKYVQSIVEEVGQHIKNAGIHATIDGRVKHFFSIYKKMKNQNKTLDQIYDLFAVRIIVDTIPDCWAALGVVHGIYKPYPGRFKDYIASPKSNMYQSLHTTVIGSSGQPFEIQIRTNEMHQIAEYGIAAHWKYKENADGKHIYLSDEKKFAWLRQILEWQKESEDNAEFLNLVKNGLDLFTDEVYCFTPNGELKQLPMGSTPVDFAYSIHSAVGNKMIGAKANGKLVNIDYKIQNGDKIEILTSNTSTGPSLDWLSFVKSAQARNKINQWFRQERKDDNIVRGKELLSSYCKPRGYDYNELAKTPYTDYVMRKYGFKEWDALLAAVGHGGLKEGQVINKMTELYERNHKKPITDEQVVETVAADAQTRKNRRFDAKSGIVVEGVDDVAFRFGKCCSPIPGDDIVGFVTRGKGVSIHRRDCVNIRNLPFEDKKRLIEADWSEAALTADNSNKYIASITIFANNRNGLLVDITRTLTEKNVPILSLSTATSKREVATVQVSFEIQSKEELTNIVEKLGQIESVLNIERTSS